MTKLIIKLLVRMYGAVCYVEHRVKMALLHAIGFFTKQL